MENPLTGLTFVAIIRRDLREKYIGRADSRTSRTREACLKLEDRLWAFWNYFCLPLA